jgi:hypothetical protein
VLCFGLSNALGAQRPGEQVPENPILKSDERFERPGSPVSFNGDETKQQSYTPLGIQVPAERDLQKQQRGVAVEPGSTALPQAGISFERPDASRSDMVADGTVTVYTENGPIIFGVTLIQYGEHGSQRIQLRQPDGKSWDGRADHLVPGTGPALEFLETQYRRGLQPLLKAPERNAVVADSGTNGAFREITLQEENGQSTRYSLDPATSRMARFEFVRSQSRGSVGNVGPVVHSYSFADFRDVDGFATPFHIEHNVDDVKQEELQLTKVRYNTAAIVAPDVRPTGR